MPVVAERVPEIATELGLMHRSHPNLEVVQETRVHAGVRVRSAETELIHEIRDDRVRGVARQSEGDDLGMRPRSDEPDAVKKARRELGLLDRDRMPAVALHGSAN